MKNHHTHTHTHTHTPKYMQAFIFMACISCFHWRLCTFEKRIYLHTDWHMHERTHTYASDERTGGRDDPSSSIQHAHVCVFSLRPPALVPPPALLLGGENFLKHCRTELGARRKALPASTAPAIGFLLCIIIMGMHMYIFAHIECQPSCT